MLTSSKMKDPGRHTEPRPVHVLQYGGRVLPPLKQSNRTTG